ncbi:MAG: DDE-type integrase/transposase/recombinase [Chloroflexota bacterium]|nr:DDE-type integrase/transposase/recombinase [Chloroflexota bacterium]
MPASKPKRIPPTHDWKQLQLRFAWPDQQRYELIRPVVLFGQTAEERALETDAPIRTIYRHLQRFTTSGLPGLSALDHHPPAHVVPDEIRDLILALKAEHPPLRTNEIATICYARTGRRPDRKTINRILANILPSPPAARRFPPFHEVADPARRRAMIIRLHVEGWTKTSIATYLQTSRPTVHDTLRRWIRDGLGGLYPQSRAPHRPHRKVTFQAMVTIRRLQRNPLIGAFRVHAALKREHIYLSPRTCGRILALHRKLYQQELPRPAAREKKAMPFAATRPHQYWSVDIRYIDHQLGGNAYCISILDNYSRAILASALTRSQNTTAFLVVLYAALRNHGVPEAIVSDGGGVFKAKQVVDVYALLGIRREQIAPRQPWQNYIETQFNVQRRMADWHFGQAATWAELVAAHETWVGDFNYQSHWAHREREDRRQSPIEVLDGALGVVYAEQDLHRVFHTLRFGRRLDRLGYVRFRHWRLYGEQGLQGNQAVLWLYGEHLTVVFTDQPLAHYTVDYQPDQKHFRSVSNPQLVETQYRSPQLPLWTFGDGEWLKVLRIPVSGIRRGPPAPLAAVQAMLPLDEAK